MPAALVAAVVLAAVPQAGVPAPVDRCTVEDPRLVELSGLAVVGGGSPEDGDLWAMADGGRRVELHRLDPATCAVVESRTADINPYDAEDLAAGPDGTLWVGDVGDNGRNRDTVAVIAVPPRGAARLHRLTYPDGPHDAEALLVDARGVPTVVTKNVGGSGIYRPEAPLTGPGPVPLVRVGDLVLPPSDTDGGPVGGLGARTVTGGAVTADGRVVALRTYTDAWLYPVPGGGGVADALLGVPVRVPLPDEPQGEALAFTADGTLLSGSEARGTTPGRIRAVPGAAALASDFRAAAPTATGPGAPGSAAPRPVEAPVAAPEPVSAWRTAATGAALLVVVLGVVAGLLSGRARRR